MQTTHRLLSAIALTCLSASSFAVTTVYTTPASFSAQVAPGAYTETFTGLANPPAGSVAFSGGAFSYAASAPGDIYLAGGFLGASQINTALTINFTSGNVKAIGANFYSTDLNDAFQAVSVTLTLSDATTVTFTPTSIANSFRGFTSTAFITSLVMSAPGQSLYAGLDNFTVGTTVAVPEPGSWLLMGLGLAALGVYRRRSV
jgi:hypothetical protein